MVAVCTVVTISSTLKAFLCVRISAQAVLPGLLATSPLLLSIQVTPSMQLSQESFLVPCPGQSHPSLLRPLFSFLAGASHSGKCSWCITGFWAAYPLSLPPERELTCCLILVSAHLQLRGHCRARLLEVTEHGRLPLSSN